MKSQHPRARRQSPESDSGVRVAWTESLAFCGPYPAPGKRFYKLETLKGAVEKALFERDRFLHSGLQSLMGTAPLSSLACDLVYEDATRLVFRVMAANRARKRIALRLVTAKNHEECSARLLKEYESLKLLYARAPEYVVVPCRGGAIFLPDRHKRKEINREIFACITRDVAGATPLYVASSTQLAPHDPQPRRYSMKDSELLKAALVRLVVSLYDPREMTGLDPADLYPECLGAHKGAGGAGGALALTLMQCRQVRRRFRAHTLIHNLLFSVLKTGTTILPMAPARPQHFFEALCGATNPETAREWCLSFLGKSGVMNAHEHEELLPGREYLTVLRELAEQG